MRHKIDSERAFRHRSYRNVRAERELLVGSQVGLFAELGAFPTLTANVAEKLQTPAVISKWINVYDPDDILSFLAAPVMSNVVDIEYDTKSPFPISHSEYWNQEAVYEKFV